MVEQLNHPSSSGVLVDPDGGVWSMSRKGLDLRIVRRAFRTDAATVVLGESNGFDLRWVAADQRAALWEQVRENYSGPGGSGGDYLGHEFVNGSRARLLYLEKAC
jgi:hypothetical protein